MSSSEAHRSKLRAKILRTGTSSLLGVMQCLTCSTLGYASPPDSARSEASDAEQPSVTAASLCVAQAENAQEFFKAGNLAQARAEVALCAQAHCPAVVRNDCESWLHEWEHPMPTDSSIPVESTTKKDRTRVIPKSTASGVQKNEPQVVHDGDSSPVWPWIALAAGAAGGVGFAYWGINGRRDAETLADTCGRNKTCTESQVVPVRNQLIYADVSLGVGLVGVGVGIVGFLMSNGNSSNVESTHGSAHRPIPATKALHIGSSTVTARFEF